MALASDSRLLVLHAIRIKGLADDAAIVEATGLAPEDIRPHLGELARSGAATHRDGKLTGWMLTSEGRAQHSKLVADELDAGQCRDAVDAAYRDFLEANGRLLGVCTDWQIKRGDEAGPAEINDHSDADYDRAVIAELRGVDDQIQPVVRRMAGILERFGPYGPRLSTAVERVEAGETEWFTMPLIDSYHTVWFELHEDLLVTLGIERSKEDG